MFPSQAQIGQDMSRERQELAARIRLAQSAASPRRQRRPKAARRRRVVVAVLKRQLAGLIARF